LRNSALILFEVTAIVYFQIPALGTDFQNTGLR